jgi:hypothetical protein
MRWCLCLLLLAACSPRPVATGASTTAPAKCADAVERVQNYVAPGASMPLKDAVAWQLALEAQRRPMEPLGWLPPEDHGSRCAAVFRVSLGNEAVSLVWWLDPQTGRVEARDDRTRRLSGW